MENNIVLSGFFIFLIVSIYFGSWSVFFYNKKFRLDERSLDQQPMFWYAVVSPLIVFFILGIFVWKDSIPDFSRHGFDEFYSISKFPLSILALSPILGAFVASVHRIIQTERQIEKTNEQLKLVKVKNNADLFYSHYKYTLDEMKNVEVINFFENPLSFRDKLKKNVSTDDGNEIEIKLNIKYPGKLYKKIFYSTDKNLKDGFEVNVNGDFFIKVIEELDLLIEVLNRYDVEINLDYDDDCYHIDSKVTFDFFKYEFLSEMKSIVDRLIDEFCLEKKHFEWKVIDDLIDVNEFDVLFDNSESYLESSDPKIVSHYIDFVKILREYILLFCDCIQEVIGIIESDPFYDYYLDFRDKEIDFDINSYCVELITTKFFMNNI
ncbi:hypothetical protein EXT68_03760 [Pectobacterium parmentieri]|nr:hypothetical protein [Pectobacterium parmentieri]MCL6354615.1 hypothetical protein [Pectobacterium parmentieri]